MNPLIKELALQAELNVTILFNKDKLEKFAHLLVQECAATVQDAVDRRQPASEYPAKLRKHFGVK